MYINSTNSTNTLLKELIAKGEWPDGEGYLYAGYQTAGRGQTGNGWESEADKNLLCSILVESRKAKDKRPFYLNVAVSVAVYRVIQSFVFERSGLGSLSEAVSIKWPNDIYWGDKKIAGILIENAIIGSDSPRLMINTSRSAGAPHCVFPFPIRKPSKRNTIDLAV